MDHIPGESRNVMLANSNSGNALIGIVVNFPDYS